MKEIKKHLIIVISILIFGYVVFMDVARHIPDGSFGKSLTVFPVMLGFMLLAIFVGFTISFCSYKKKEDTE